MHLTKSSGALHWWWVTAHLYEQQIFIGVIAVTQGCCEPVLKSSPEQCGMHFALQECVVSLLPQVKINLSRTAKAGQTVTALPDCPALLQSYTKLTARSHYMYMQHITALQALQECVVSLLPQVRTNSLPRRQGRQQQPFQTALNS